jgi:hypothetical protein
MALSFSISACGNNLVYRQNGPEIFQVSSIVALAFYINS